MIAVLHKEGRATHCAPVGRTSTLVPPQPCLHQHTKHSYRGLHARSAMPYVLAVQCACVHLWRRSPAVSQTLQPRHAGRWGARPPRPAHKQLHTHKLPRPCVYGHTCNDGTSLLLVLGEGGCAPPGCASKCRACMTSAEVSLCPVGPPCHRGLQEVLSTMHQSAGDASILNTAPPGATPNLQVWHMCTLQLLNLPKRSAMQLKLAVITF